MLYRMLGKNIYSSSGGGTSIFITKRSDYLQASLNMNNFQSLRTGIKCLGNIVCVRYSMHVKNIFKSVYVR
jgi:hypothetical protein